MEFEQGAASTQDRILRQLTRIADAQENLLAIAIEARGERVKMAAKMADALKRPLQEKP